MRKFFIYILVLIAATSCNSSAEEKKVTVNTVDSNLTVTPVTPIAVDTDDHNKAGMSEVALDSPVGPRNAADTIGQRQ